jgi:hypothetical protein
MFSIAYPPSTLPVVKVGLKILGIRTMQAFTIFP